MVTVEFFDTQIKIKAHSATDSTHVGVPVSIESFSDGEPVLLYRVNDKDLYCIAKNTQRFIEGPEVR